MAIHGIDHYNLRGSREVIEELKDFYQRVLGLQVGPRPGFASRGYLLYADDLPLLHLSEMAAGEHRPPNTAGTFDHVAFACHNLDDFEAVLKAHEIPYTLDTIPGLGNRQMFFTDPAGNGIELNLAPEA